MPLCGEGIEARSTGRTFCPRSTRRRWPALEQDLQGELGRAAALEQLDREVEVDVEPPPARPRRPGRSPARISSSARQRSTRSSSVSRRVQLRSSHRLLGIRSKAHRITPDGGSPAVAGARSASACAFVSVPSSRNVSGPRVQRRTLPRIRRPLAELPRRRSRSACAARPSQRPGSPSTRTARRGRRRRASSGTDPAPELADAAAGRP